MLLRHATIKRAPYWSLALDCPSNSNNSKDGHKYTPQHPLPFLLRGVARHGMAMQAPVQGVVAVVRGRGMGAHASDVMQWAGDQ